MVWWLYLFRKKSPVWPCLLSASNDFLREQKRKRLLVSKVKVGKIRIEKNREFSCFLACVSVKPYSLTAYKINEHKRPPTFINREFWENLCKILFFSENLSFSIFSLFGRVYAISASHSLGKIKIQKNPAIKDWIERVQKNGRPFSLNPECSLKLKRSQVNRK